MSKWPTAPSLLTDIYSLRKSGVPDAPNRRHVPLIIGMYVQAAQKTC